MFPSPGNHRSAAFTLVELLVVIAIIGVLVGLLLPAVQAAREAARRMQCSNNLKQISLALHNYHTAISRLPYGNLDEGTTSFHRRDTWAQQIWPYLEQQAAYDAYMAWNGVWIMDAPKAVRDLVVSAYVCPSDANAPGFGGGGPFRSDAYGFQGNYAGNAGDGFIKINRPSVDPSNAMHDLSGIFHNNSKVRIDDIRDGTSNTLLISEVLIRGKKGDDGWGEGGGYWGGGQHGSFGFSAMENPNSTISDRAYQCKSTTHLRAPCTTIGGNIDKLNLARGNHPGGVLASLADGSVRFVSESVNLTTWKSLATRAGGEVVDSSAF